MLRLTEVSTLKKEMGFLLLLMMITIKSQEVSSKNEEGPTWEVLYHTVSTTLESVMTNKLILTNFRVKLIKLNQS